MAERKQIPVLVLTGFLGAGKTTLLASWLRAPQFSRAMVIVNELGEVGLDDMLVQHSSDAPLLLENGCACCTAAEDLNATLERLFWDRLHRKIAPFDWVLIETTGVADPGAVLAAMQSSPVVRERYGPVSVVTVFDAVHGPQHLHTHSESMAQVLHAHAVIVSKSDLANEQQLAQAREMIAAHNPQAILLQSALTASAETPAACELAAQVATLAQGALPQTQKPAQEAARPSARFAHGPGLSSAFVPLEAAFNRDEVQLMLQDFVAANERHLLRLKGLVAMPDNGLAVVQWTPGAPVMINARTAASDSTSPQRRCGLTLIASGESEPDSDQQNHAQELADTLAAALRAPVKNKPRDTLIKNSHMKAGNLSEAARRALNLAE